MSMRPWIVLLHAPRRICLHKAKASEWSTGIPVLVHCLALAMFHMAAVGFYITNLCICMHCKPKLVLNHNKPHQIVLINKLAYCFYEYNLDFINCGVLKTA